MVAHLAATIRGWIGGRNDFEAGGTYRFDLNIFNVETFSGITSVDITKTGDDGVCISEIALFVNGTEVVRDYLRGDGSCTWFDPDVSYEKTIYTIPMERFRSPSSEGWRLAKSTLYHNDGRSLPWVNWIFREEIEDRIETFVGDLLHGLDLRWEPKGRRAVEVWIEDAEEGILHVDLDLEYDSVVNPDIDVDFTIDLDLTCVPAEDDPLQDPHGPDAELRLTAQLGNFEADTGWYWDVLAVPGVPLGRLIGCLFGSDCSGIDGPLEWLNDGWGIVGNELDKFVNENAASFFRHIDIPVACQVLDSLGMQPDILLTQDESDLVRLGGAEPESFPQGDAQDFALKFWGEGAVLDTLAQALVDFEEEVHAEGRVTMPSWPIVVTTKPMTTTSTDKGTGTFTTLQIPTYRSTATSEPSATIAAPYTTYRMGF